MGQQGYRLKYPIPAIPKGASAGGQDDFSEQPEVGLDAPKCLLNSLY
jgi:hypothetical protein